MPTLPPYSPDLNPIELWFAKLKALLRTGRRTVDKPWTTVTACCPCSATAGMRYTLVKTADLDDSNEARDWRIYAEFTRGLTRARDRSRISPRGAVIRTARDLYVNEL